MIAIATASAAADFFLSRRHGVSVGGGSDQGHDFSRLRLLDDGMSDQRTAQDHTEQHGVNHYGPFEARGTVIVVLTPDGIGSCGARGRGPGGLWFRRRR